MARPFNYTRALKAMRGKIAFNYDLRYKLTPGQKAAIRRNYNDFVHFKNQQFIKPPKRPGESSTHYDKRIRSLKAQFGQEDMAFRGVWINTPKKLHYRIYNNRIHTFGINGGGRRVSETHVPINPQRLVREPTELFAEIWQRFNPFRAMWLSYHGYRGKESIEDTDEEDIFADTATALVNAIGSRYKGKNKDPLQHITGVIILH